MSLSDDEQFLLREIEQSLYKDDPDLRRVFADASPPSLLRARRLVAGVVLTLLGVGVVLTGVVTALAFVGVSGFLIMLTGGVLAHGAVKPWFSQERSFLAPPTAMARPPRE